MKIKHFVIIVFALSLSVLCFLWDDFSYYGTRILYSRIFGLIVVFGAAFYLSGEKTVEKKSQARRLLILIIGLLFIGAISAPVFKYIQKQKSFQEQQAASAKLEQERQAEEQARQAQEAKAKQEQQTQFEANKPLYDECIAEANKDYLERWNKKCAEIADKWQLDYNECMEHSSEAFCLSLHGRKPVSQNCELPLDGYQLNSSYQAAKNECESQYPIH